MCTPSRSATALDNKDGGDYNYNSKYTSVITINFALLRYKFRSQGWVVHVEPPLIQGPEDTHNNCPQPTLFSLCSVSHGRDSA